MSNVIIGRAEFSDESTLTAGNERSGFPATNLQKQQVSRFWKSNGLSNVYFVLDRSGTAPWDTVALLYTNATSAATWRIRAANTEADLTNGSAAYDSGTLTFWAEADMASWALRHGLLHLSAAQTLRYLRIDLTDASNANDLTAGRLVVGNFWQPTVNMEYPLQFGPEDDAKLERSQGGALFADQRDTYNKATVRLNFLDEDEMLNNAFDLRRHGKADDLLVVLNPASTSHLAKQMIYGLLTRNQPIVHPAFGIYSHVLTIAEMATIARIDPVVPGQTPTLLDFAAGDFSLLTLTRATVGTRINVTGGPEEVAIDTPRLTYDPTTHVAQGLLVEPSRTNVVKNSGELVSSPWSLGANLSRTTGQTDPAGGTTAVRLTCDTAGTSTSNYLRAFSATSGHSSGKYSIWVKRVTGTGTVKLLNLNNSTGQGLDITADLTSTWQLFQKSGPSGGGFLYLGPSVETLNDEIDVAFAELEADITGEISSFIDTTTTALTRAQDLATVSMASINGFTAASFSVVLEIILQETDGVLFAMGTGSTPELELDMQSGDLHLTGPNGLDLTAASGLSAGDTIKVALRMESDNVAVSVDGATVVTDTSHTMLENTTVAQLGADLDAANAIICTIANITFSAALSDAELETESA